VPLMLAFRLSLGSALLSLSLLVGVAAHAAEPYPVRPVRWLVGFTAGGSNDLVARLLADRLSARLGQRFIVENRPGGSNNVATAAVISSPPDGYMLYFVNAANFINATLFSTLPFDFLRDMAPVAGIMRVPNVLEINPSVPARSVPEFIAYAKANPGKLSMASSGVGTSIHLAGEMFKMMAAVELIHVPYKGTPPAITDIIAGHVQVIFDNLPSSVGHIRDGRLRALAVTTLERAPTMPELPTVAETVPGYESSSLFGIGVPSGTPREIIATLNSEVNLALADPAIRARLIEMGGILVGGSPEDLRKMSVEEVEKWGRAVRSSGAKAD
jgi:tripartite-type tricarboxylate transporter receptor subunit TctC